MLNAILSNRTGCTLHWQSIFVSMSIFQLWLAPEIIVASSPSSVTRLSLDNSAMHWAYDADYGPHGPRPTGPHKKPPTFLHCNVALIAPPNPFTPDLLPADAFVQSLGGASGYLELHSTGQTGIPRIDLTPRGLNAVNTSGPLVTASVNGHGAASTVFLGNGASYVDALDLNLPLNGHDWYHQRVFSSKSSSSLDWQGEGWWGNEMMHIAVAGSEGTSNVAVTFDPHYTLNFT